MKLLIGVFPSVDVAEEAGRALRAVGVAENHLLLLTPEGSGTRLQSVSPEKTAGACGTTAGHLMGAATGFASGVLGGAAVILLVSGVGPIVAVGSLVVGSLVGVAVGATLGGLMQRAFDMTIAPEEFFVYEDVLRQGFSLLIVKPSNEEQRHAADQVLTRLGTKGFDALREQWWQRLREEEAAAYKDSSTHFADHEFSYRRGFEAALDARDRGKTFAEAASVLALRAPGLYQDKAFRHGFERGQTYYHAMREHDLVAHTQPARP
jgi:hypothetical protein